MNKICYILLLYLIFFGLLEVVNILEHFMFMFANVNISIMVYFYYGFRCQTFFYNFHTLFNSESTIFKWPYFI